MISRLYIGNIALIDRLDMPLSAGFNVLTGETGAGKSVVIDAMNLVLGARADRDLIRTGADYAIVEAAFEIDGRISAFLAENEIQTEDDQLILSREISLSGKNVCRINGRMTPLSTLKAAAEFLVDIHGQHEQQDLFNPDRHIVYLDRYCAQELADIKRQVSMYYGEWRALRHKLKFEIGSDSERARKMDMLNYQIDEIVKADLSQGEEEELLERRAIMMHSEKIMQALEQASGSLDSDEEVCALTLLNQAFRAMQGICGLNEKYEAIMRSVEEAYYSVQESARDIADLKDAVVFDAYEYDEIEKRLSAIDKLKRKYGDSVGQILKFCDNARQELDRLEELNVVATSGAQKLGELEVLLYDACCALSVARRECAARFEVEMTEHLKDLSLEKARFSVSFADIPPLTNAMEFTSNGLDKVEMLLSANPGEPLKPLRKVASGGEASRILLAFKCLLADALDYSTLIFDEIDTGISGKTSTVVGDKMRAIASSRQVICVTHSAQIAAMADAHYFIDKAERDGRISTSVKLLDSEEHIREVARILSGSDGEQTAIEHARELIARYAH